MVTPLRNRARRSYRLKELKAPSHEPNPQLDADHDAERYPCPTAMPSAPDQLEALPPYVRALLRPEAYPHDADGLRLHETHISWVVLAGPHAYKVKKPVEMCCSVSPGSSPAPSRAARSAWPSVAHRAAS